MKLRQQPLRPATVAASAASSALIIALIIAVAVVSATAAAVARIGVSTAVGGTTSISVGSDPDGTAVDAVTGMVYVADAGSDSVTVIDGATGTVTATIPVGSEPAGIAVDDDTDMIYVANHGAPTVSVIDGATNTVTATVTVGATNGPDAVAVDPATDKIFVTTYGYIAQIDGATDQVTPGWFRVTSAGIGEARWRSTPPPGTCIWSTSGPMTRSSSLTPRLPRRPALSRVARGALAVDPVSNLLYVANCDPGFANGVWIFNLTSGNIQAENADSCPTAVGADAANGTGVAVDQSTGATSVISAKGAVLGTLTAATAPDAAGPTDPATGLVSVSGNTIYIADQDSNGTVTAITQTAPQITSAPAATFTAGTNGTYTLTAAGIPQHITFTATGRLPNGLRLSRPAR